MANGIASNLPNQNQTAARPSISSYDSAYEHSLDRYVDVKLLVHDAENEASDVPATYASAS
jgi:hypothetical protein